jgi:hypothetical protein
MQQFCNMYLFNNPIHLILLTILLFRYNFSDCYASRQDIRLKNKTCLLLFREANSINLIKKNNL